MKNILFTLMFTMAFMAGFSQLYNSGGAITVQSGATLVIEGNYTCDNSATIDIDGNVELKGHLVNNGGTIVNGGAGTLKFNGTLAQEIKGSSGTTFNCAVEINNAQGVSLQSADAVLAAALTFTNGKLTLNAYDLTLAAAGVTGAGAGKYIVTNDPNGEVKATVAASNVLFPVGSSTDYNPLVLNNTGGTSDTYGVRFTSGMPSGWTGTDHSINGHWTVTEGTGTGSNLDVTTQWNLGQEQTNFDRTDCAVGVSGDLGATVNWAASSAASGTNPYTQVGNDFTSVGTFLVGDAFYLFINLDLDVFLAGPYSGGAMSLALNTNGLIQTTDPYGLGTTVTNVPSNAVDWVLVEFRNKSNSSQVQYSKAFFVDNNGNIIHTDGTTGAKVTGVPKDQYYIAIRHRNHLGAMTLNTVDLTNASPAFNFTTGTANLYGTNATRNMGGGIYALWGGDADGDGVLRFGASPSDITPINSAVMGDVNNTGNSSLFVGALVYSDADTDMDGRVRFGASPSDITPINASVLGNPANTNNNPLTSLTQQLP